MNTNALTVTPLRSSYTGAQLDLIKRTVAADTNAEEFNLFIAVAQRAQLDPLRKQISAIVFNKNAKDQSRRRMAIITTIDGLRSIAARSLRYRPDEDEPDFTYDEAAKSDLNPLGLVRARVNVYMKDADANEWRRVPGVAYWDEFAPIEAEWAEGEDGRRRPTGAQKLSDTWKRMGRLMLAKCAESQALRKAFPEDLSGLYEGAEFDRQQVIDVTATEIIEQHHVEQRLALTNTANTITLQLSATEPLTPIPIGQIYDRVVEASASWDINQTRWFMSANTHPLREYWARAKSDALALKQHLEKLTADLMQKAQNERAGAASA